MKMAMARSDNVLDHSKCIVHIDVNCFYAQVEVLANPVLQGRPVGVRQKGLLVTCNYVARAFGVKKMHSIKEALIICPEMIIIDGSDLTSYRKASDDIFRLAKRYASHVRKLGLDECFLDVTELINQRMATHNHTAWCFVGHVYSNESGYVADQNIDCRCGCIQRLQVASAVAQEIRQALFDELGFQTCAGIAVNKNLAKLAGDLHKPNQQTTLLPQNAHDMILTKKMHDIPGCGFRLSQRLADLHIHSTEELQRIPLARLLEEFGPRIGRNLFRLCRGLDEEDGVKPTEAAKTMSEEDSFRHCVTRADAQARLQMLATQLLERLDERWDERGEAPATLRLSLRQTFSDDDYFSRDSKQTFFPPISLGERARQSAKINRVRLPMLMISVLELFDKLVGTRFDIMLFNLALCDFKPSSNNGSVQPISNYFLAEDPPAPDNQPPPASTQGPQSCTFSSLEAGETLLECRQCGNLVRECDAHDHLQFHRNLHGAL